MKGWGVRLLVVLGLVAALVYFKPDWVKKAPYGEQVVQYRQQVLGASTSAEGLAAKLPQVPLDQWVEQIKQVKLPQNPFTGEPKEVKVEELLGQLGEELKKLPAEKAKEVTTNFCQDVLKNQEPN